MEDLRPRIEKLEEAAAFTERTVEQLNEQVLKAVEGLEALAKRVRALEARLSQVGASEDDEESFDGEGGS